MFYKKMSGNGGLKFVFLLSFLTFFIFLQSPVFAQSSTSNGDFEVSKYDSDISISESKVTVKETINVNFPDSRHGIFRYIPEIYQYVGKDGKKSSSRLVVKINEVTDERGNPYTTKIFEQKSSRLNTDFLLNGLFNNILVIQIGDPDRTIIGEHVYVLNYELSNFPAQADPLSFGTPGSWPVDINNFTANVTLESSKNNPTVTAKYGTLGTSENDATSVDVIKLSSNSYRVEKKLIYNGDSIQIYIPGLIFTHDKSDLSIFLSEYWFVLVPIISIIGIAIWWFKTQRNPKGTGIIVPQFSFPDDLRPAEVGTLNDDTVDKVDVSATIIDLAVRKYLKINNISDNEKKLEFELELLKGIQDDNDLKDYEITLLTSIFTTGQTKVSLDSMKNDFYSTYEKIKRQMYNKMVLNGYYRSVPGKELALVFSGIFAVLMAVPAISLNLLSTVETILIGILSFCISFLFFFFRGYNTQKGVDIREKIAGMKLFIDTAKKDQLNMLQTPMSKQEIFESYLPYAMVFGLHQSWAKVFADMNISTPSWYSSPYSNNVFNTLFFVSYMNSFSSGLNGAFTPPASSGDSFGGGSFGGGFSGGGGGSW